MTDAGKDAQVPLRQFLILLDESTSPGRLYLTLRWRSFPCKASEWDGSAHATLEGDVGALDSPQALRAALLMAADSPWLDGWSR